MSAPDYKRVFLVTNRAADTYGAIGVFCHWIVSLGMVVLRVGAVDVAYFSHEVWEVPV